MLLHVRLTVDRIPGDLLALVDPATRKTHFAVSSLNRFLRDLGLPSSPPEQTGACLVRQLFPGRHPGLADVWLLEMCALQNRLIVQRALLPDGPRALRAIELHDLLFVGRFRTLSETAATLWLDACGPDRGLPLAKRVEEFLRTGRPEPLLPEPLSPDESFPEPLSPGFLEGLLSPGSLPEDPSAAGEDMALARIRARTRLDEAEEELVRARARVSACEVRRAWQARFLDALDETDRVVSDMARVEAAWARALETNLAEVERRARRAPCRGNRRKRTAARRSVRLPPCRVDCVTSETV